MINIPIIITLIRFPLIFPAIFALWKREYLIALILLLTLSISDALDGYLARKLNQVTHIGTLLDSSADKLLFIPIYIMLSLQDEIPLYLASIIVSYNVALILGHGMVAIIVGKVNIPQPLTSRTTNFFTYFLIITIPCHYVTGEDVFIRAYNLSSWIVIIATILSGITYIVEVTRLMKKTISNA